MAGCAVVLKSITKGKYVQVAEALKAILGLQEQVSGRIVSSLPIVLFEGLEETQACAVAYAMLPVEEAGATLEVDPEGASGLARMSWPDPPTISGRDLESFASPQAFTALRCPACGTELVLMPAGAPAEAPEEPAAAIEPDPAFDVTGEEDLEMLGEVELGTRAPDVPKVPAAPKTPPPPEAPARSAATVVPMDLEDFEASFADQAEEELGRDGVLQELGEAQTKPVAEAPPARPKQAPAGGQAQPPSAQPKPPGRTPARPARRSGSGPKTPARARRGKKSGSGSIPSAGTGIYSVFASKSSSPRFLEIVAEVQGITPKEAKKLAKRPVVQVVRDVSQKEAEDIRDLFLAERFQARVHSKGG